MTTPRRKYDAAFREEAVRLVLSTNRSVKQVAEEIGVKESTLGNWLHRYRERQPDAAFLRRTGARWRGMSIRRLWPKTPG